MISAAALAEILSGFDDIPALRHLHIRIRDLGDDDRDEVEEFRQLQQACRELRALNDALITAGVPDVAHASTAPVAHDVGEVIQVFNEVIEEIWARGSRV